MPGQPIILGKYELLEVIGGGAEGRVYRARCVADDVPGVAQGEMVALKRLKSTGQEKSSSQFRRQSEILSKLIHPNIVCYKDSFICRDKELEDDIRCLVMELLSGETLKTVLEKNPKGLPWPEVRSLFSQILQALQFAARSGVVHRDLKPSNVYITENGTPKLVDFGIARRGDGDSSDNSTVAGAKGTFDYMAPDFALQHGGFRGDEQSEIFSFGVMLYHALTGSLPFPPMGENPEAGYYVRWLKSPPKPDFRNSVFRVLSHARTGLSKCIECERETRARTFEEVAALFAKIGYRQLKHGAETYEFSEWLGKGGFGEVFRARRLSDGREVAIKRLFSSVQSTRFVREAKLLRSASHPHLTEYIDFFEVRQRGDDPEYYLILEYLPGMPAANLRERIKSSSFGLDPAEALPLFTGYLDCLDHLHRNGIIHRDIKPGNLYAPENHPQDGKIFDLGIARDEEGTATHGTMPGTLDFMAPEFAVQSSGRGSPQSDIYSLGITLYLALTKQLPFPRLPERESEAWVAFIRRSEEPLTAPFDHPVFARHPELVPLIERAFAADPKQRPPSAKAMSDEIRGILAGWEKRKSCDETVAAARAALAGRDYDEAERQAKRALELVSSDQPARQVLFQAQQQRMQERKRREEAAAELDDQPTGITAVKGAEAMLANDEEETRVASPQRMAEIEDAVAGKRPDRIDPDRSDRKRGGRNNILAAAAVSLLIVGAGWYAGWRFLMPRTATPPPEAAAAQAERDRKYSDAMNAAQAAYDRNDYTAAVEQASAALGFRAADVSAARLLTDAHARLDAIAAQVQRDAKYNDALEAAQKALDEKAYAGAIAQADLALGIRSGDPAALKLKSDAQARIDEAAAQADSDRKYGTAMDAARKAFDDRVYAQTVEQAGVALGLRPGDAEALKLKSDAQAQLDEIAAQADRDRKYADALGAAQAAWDGKAYAKAVEQAGIALGIRADDSAALKLRSEAQACLDGIAEQEAENTRKFGEAMAAARKAFDDGAFSGAVAQAAVALGIRHEDAEALKLRSDAQARLDQIAAQQAAQSAQDAQMATETDPTALLGRLGSSDLGEAFAAWKRLCRLPDWPGPQDLGQIPSAASALDARLPGEVSDSGRRSALHAEILDGLGRSWQGAFRRARNDKDIGAVMDVISDFGIREGDLAPRERFNIVLWRTRRQDWWHKTHDQVVGMRDLIVTQVSALDTLATLKGQAPVSADPSIHQWLALIEEDVPDSPSAASGMARSLGGSLISFPGLDPGTVVQRRIASLPYLDLSADQPADAATGKAQ